jgi:hypothetical protein
MSPTTNSNKIIIFKSEHPCYNWISSIGNIVESYFIVSAGGSMSNMYGMVLARYKAVPDSKMKGLSGLPPLVAFTSEDVSHVHCLSNFRTTLSSFIFLQQQFMAVDKFQVLYSWNWRKFRAIIYWSWLEIKSYRLCRIIFINTVFLGTILVVKNTTFWHVTLYNLLGVYFWRNVLPFLSQLSSKPSKQQIGLSHPRI